MIIFVIFLFVAAFTLEAVFGAAPFRSIEFHITSNRKCAETGESLEIQSTITNRGKLPVNYVNIIEKLPPGAELVKSDSRAERVYDIEIGGYKPKGSLSVINNMFLMPSSRHTVTREVKFEKRGRYIFHGASLTVGDFLGIAEYTANYDTFIEAVVLPKRAENVNIPDMLSGLMGDLSVRRFIHEDPVLTIGYREYTGREPMKAISWTQSAKVGSLIVKKYDHTTELSVSVILNTECVKKNKVTLSKEQTSSIEYALSLTRSVCEYLDEKRIPYSYSTNANIYGGRRIKLSLRTGFGHDHLMSVLENLGRTGYDVTEHISETLYRASLQRTQGTAFIIITAEKSDALSMSVNRLKAIGDVYVFDASELKGGADNENE